MAKVPYYSFVVLNKDGVEEVLMSKAENPTVPDGYKLVRPAGKVVRYEPDAEEPQNKVPTVPPASREAGTPQKNEDEAQPPRQRPVQRIPNVRG